MNNMFDTEGTVLAVANLRQLEPSPLYHHSVLMASNADKFMARFAG